MKYIFELNHPKHYHQFKYIICQLKVDHEVIIIAREKEVLFNLLDENKVEYIRFTHSKSGSIFKKIWCHLFSLRKLQRIVIRFKPNYFLSKASASTIFVKIFRPSCKTVIFPDSEVVWLTNTIVSKFANRIITPEVFQRDFGKKHIRIPGIFENSYLAPNYYKIEHINIQKYGYDVDRRTVFIRFVGWKANHDISHFGFNEMEKEELINLFERHKFNIIISAETYLPDCIKKYLNPFPTSIIHSVLKVCNFYVGDSQTMASESALLGLKSFRYNSFVGESDMSNFKFLESKRLLKNFNNFALLICALESEISGANSFFSDIGNYWKEYGDQNQEIYDFLINYK